MYCNGIIPIKEACVSWQKPSSTSSPCNENIFEQVCDIAQYLYSTYDLETLLCFLLFYEMSAGSRNIHQSVVDLRVLEHLA